MLQPSLSLIEVGEHKFAFDILDHCNQWEIVATKFRHHQQQLVPGEKVGKVVVLPVALDHAERLAVHLHPPLIVVLKDFHR